jgi:hypothetical protein
LQRSLASMLYRGGGESILTQRLLSVSSLPALHTLAGGQGAQSSLGGLRHGCRLSSMMLLGIWCRSLKDSCNGILSSRMNGCRFKLKLLKLLATAPGSGALLMAPLGDSATLVHLTKPKDLTSYSLPTSRSQGLTSYSLDAVSLVKGAC